MRRPEAAEATEAATPLVIFRWQGRNRACFVCPSEKKSTHKCPLPGYLLEFHKFFYSLIEYYVMQVNVCVNEVEVRASASY